MSYWNRYNTDAGHGSVKKIKRAHGVAVADPYGRCKTGADSKKCGPFGRLEYSTTNSTHGTQISHRGCKDA